MRYVIVPGINGSGDEHWQSIWQAAWGSSAARISPASWDEPDLDDWCRAIDDAVGPPRSAGIVLVAHSLGCLAAVHWAVRRRPDGAGLFLVAPPDATAAGFPADAAPTFANAMTASPGTPGLIVTSEDDPYCTTGAARRLVQAWKMDHVTAGNAGHLNAGSGLGGWDFGRGLLAGFEARLSSGARP